MRENTCATLRLQDKRYTANCKTHAHKDTGEITTYGGAAGVLLQLGG